MAIFVSRISVTDTQIQVNSAVDLANNAGLAIRNRGTAAVYLGPTGVTTATGYQLDPGETLSLSGYAGRDAIFAIAATPGPFVLHTLRHG